MSFEIFQITNQSNMLRDISSKDEWAFEAFESIRLFSLNNLIEPSTELLIDSVANLSFGEDDHYSINTNQNYKIKKDIRNSGIINEDSSIIKENKETKPSNLELLLNENTDYISPQPITELVISNSLDQNQSIQQEVINNPLKLIENQTVIQEEAIEENKRDNETITVINKDKDENSNKEYNEEYDILIKDVKEIKSKEQIEEETCIEDIQKIKDNNTLNESNANKTINELTEKLEKAEKKYHIMHDSNNKLLEVINIFKKIQSIDSKSTFNSQDINNEIKSNNQNNIKRANSEDKVKMTIVSQETKPKLYIDYVQTNNKSYAEIHGKENQKNTDNTILQVKNQCKCGLYEINNYNNTSNSKEIMPCNKGLIKQMIYSSQKPQLKRMNLNPVNVNKPTHIQKRIEEFQEGNINENEGDNKALWYNNTNSFKQISFNRMPFDNMAKKEFQTLSQDNKIKHKATNDELYSNSINNYRNIYFPNTSLDDYFKQPVNEIKRFPSFQWNHGKMLSKPNMCDEDNINSIKNNDIYTLSSPYCKIKPISLAKLTRQTNTCDNMNSLSIKNKNKYVDYKQFQVIFEDDDTKTNTNFNHTLSNNITDTKVNEINHDNNKQQKIPRRNDNKTVPFYLLSKKELMKNAINSLYEKPKKLANHYRKASKKLTECPLKQSQYNK